MKKKKKNIRNHCCKIKREEELKLEQQQWFDNETKIFQSQRDKIISHKEQLQFFKTTLAQEKEKYKFVRDKKLNFSEEDHVCPWNETEDIEITQEKPSHITIGFFVFDIFLILYYGSTFYLERVQEVFSPGTIMIFDISIGVLIFATCSILTFGLFGLLF